MRCISCNTEIPNVRVSLGYKECVNCSTVDTYGAINIIYHKTGNDIQITDKETAASVNKLGDRKFFGSVLKAGSKGGYNPKNVKIGCSNTIIGSEGMYNVVGEESMSLFEKKGVDAAFAHIDKAVRNYDINRNQAYKLKQIFKAL